MDEFGGLDGVSNWDNLMGALGRPYHGYHKRVWDKGAALLHGVAISHGFVDGNKRTSWLLTDLLYINSGYRIDLLEGDRIDDIVVDVVNHQMTEVDLKLWLKQRTSGPFYFD